MSLILHTSAYLRLCAPLFIVMSIAPSVAFASALSISTEKDSYGPGDTFVATIHLDPYRDECVNAVQIAVTYPPQLLQASAVAKAESILSLWPTEPLIDQERGVVTYTGGIPAGYCGRVQGDPGETNITAKIIFTVLAGGSDLDMMLGFDSTQTQVLLNDGLGSPSPIEFRNANITRTATSAGGVNEWLTEVHEDTIPPEPFSVLVHRDEKIFQGKYFLVFGATDKQSGVHHYEILEEDPERPGYAAGGKEKVYPITASTPYVLLDQTLKSKISVRAIDHAGNSEETIVMPDGGPISLVLPVGNTTPSFTLWIWIISCSVGVLALGLGYYFWKRSQKLEDEVV
jgi:hypothetical protein